MLESTQLTNADDKAKSTAEVLNLLKLISLGLVGPILLMLWLRFKLGIWWPDFKLIGQFWSDQSWWLAGQFLIGWVLGWGLLKLDQQNSRTWYQAQPLTRSISFCLVLFGLGIFVMSSTDNWLGMAMVLSMWSQLLVEVFVWQTSPKMLAETFLHDIRSSARLDLATKLVDQMGYLMVAGWVLLVIIGLL